MLIRIELNLHNELCYLETYIIIYHSHFILPQMPSYSYYAFNDQDHLTIRTLAYNSTKDHI